MWSHKCEKLFYSCHVPVSQHSIACRTIMLVRQFYIAFLMLSLVDLFFLLTLWWHCSSVEHFDYFINSVYRARRLHISLAFLSLSLIHLHIRTRCLCCHNWIEVLCALFAECKVVTYVTPPPPPRASASIFCWFNMHSSNEPQIDKIWVQHCIFPPFAVLLFSNTVGFLFAISFICWNSSCTSSGCALCSVHTWINDDECKHSLSLYDFRFLRDHWNRRTQQRQQ